MLSTKYYLPTLTYVKLEEAFNIGRFKDKSKMNDKHLLN